VVIGFVGCGVHIRTAAADAQPYCGGEFAEALFPEA